jgi:ABC-type sugar transport system permease subunit
MNKRKELWWFLIPFLLLPVAGSFGYLCEQIDAVPQFVSVENYFLLFLRDPRFWVSLMNTMAAQWLTAAVLALVLGLAVRWLRVSRAAKYAILFTAAVVMTAVIWCAGVRLMPRWYNLLHFATYGNAAAFFAWLAECVWTAVKKPKQESEAV